MTEPRETFLANLSMVDDVIRSVVRKHRCRPEEAEEFAGVVRLKMIESDYAVFRKFEGRSALKTYLTTVVLRIFLDERTRRWGRWRPSSTARKLGALATSLERLIDRDGLSLEQAIQTLRTNFGCESSRQHIEELAQQLPPRMPRPVTGSDVPENVPAPSSADDDVLRTEAAAEASRVTAALRDSLNTLDDEDRLILRLRFEDGWRVAQIARSLRLDEKPLYRRIDRLLARMRGTLESAGIGSRDVAGLMGGHDIEWVACGVRNGARVSVQPSEGEL